MDDVYPNSTPGQAWVKSISSSVVFAGAIVGMLSLGMAGDLLGRNNAMILTLSFTAAGALLSALASWGSTDTVYMIICASRFLMGMGVGGVYPLSATKAAEETAVGDDAQLRVAWSFFWQTPGAIAPYCVAVIVYLLIEVPALPILLMFSYVAVLSPDSRSLPVGSERQVQVGSRPRGCACSHHRLERTTERKIT